MTSRWCWLVFVAACRDPAPAVAPAPSAPAPVTPAPAAPDAVAIGLAPIDASPPPAAVEPTTPDPCVGDSLDLHALRQFNGCPTTAQPHIPDSVTLSIDPATITVKSGKTFPAKLIVTNPTSGTVELVVNDACGALSQIESSMLDDRGTRVDDSPTTCAMMCGMSRMAFALKPGGTAWVPFDVDARVMVYDKDSCSPSRSNRAVRPGSYDLVVASPLGTVHGRVRVQ